MELYNSFLFPVSIVDTDLAMCRSCNSRKGVKVGENAF